MRNLTSVFFVLILTQFPKCCPQKDYAKIALSPYENAVAILTAKRDSFLKYQKDLNQGDTDFILLVSKDEFSTIAQQERDNLSAIMKLWDEDLLENAKASLWFMKNGNVYFKIDECHDSRDYIVYDGGEEIMIDVQSDIRKYRIKPNWIYMRMMK